MRTYIRCCCILALYIGFFMQEKISMTFKGFWKSVKWGSVFSALGVVVIFLYKNFLIMPNIKCTIDDEQNKMVFSSKEDFRGITLKLYPQMVIQFDDYVVLLIHLDKYFQKDYLYFDENNKCQTEIQGKEYADKLEYYMREEIIRLVDAQDNRISQDEISNRLKIYISVLGGVRYETKEGNEEKRFCVIVEDGLVQDYDDHDQEITCRLNETSLEIQENIVGIETDTEIQTIIFEIVRQLELLY